MQDDERRHLQEFVMLINNNIRQFEMEIKKGVSETDGSSCYGLVRPKIKYFYAIMVLFDVFKWLIIWHKWA